MATIQRSPVTFGATYVRQCLVQRIYHDRMDRRVTGVTVMVVVLLAVVTVSGLRGRLVPGLAAHGAGIQSGDCALLDPLPTIGDPADVRRTAISQASWTACSSAGAGTVLGILGGGPLPQDSTPAAYAVELKRCAPALDSFVLRVVGSDLPWDVTGDHLTFRPATVQALGAVPAHAVDRSGQPIGVCVAAQTPTDGHAALVSIDPDRPGDALGVCSPSGADRGIVACTTPHRFETLAFVVDRVIRMGVDARGLQGCRSFLAVAVGHGDPTFGGALKVVLDPLTTDDKAPISCSLEVIDPARQLTGSLLGIGDRPLPLS